MNAGIRATGSALPRTALPNSALVEALGVDEEWMRSRTGIRQRYVAGEGEDTGTLAAEAARRALEQAQLAAGEVDLIIVATTTPDQITPAVAPRVQHLIGASCPAFDLNATCAGFVYALSVGEQWIRCGTGQRVLVIGADRASILPGEGDRNTRPLFGDGAGAVLLEATEGVGVVACELGSKGALRGVLEVPLGEQTLHMAGRELYRLVLRQWPPLVRRVCETAGWATSEVDHYVFHQASERIPSALSSRLELRPEQLVSNVARVGNTSAASIPIALDEVNRAGGILEGQRLVLAGMGAGLVWGAIALQWRSLG